MDKAVLYVGRFSLPYGTAAAQRVKVNKKAIEKAGYKVKFVSTFEDDINFTDFDNNYNINNIDSKRFLYDISYIRKIIENSKEEIHAVIFYNFPSISLLRISRYLKKKNIKVLADCTEWYSVPQSKNMFRNIVKFLDTEFRMRVVHKKTDGLICISSYLEKYYNTKKVNTILIPNLLDMQEDKWKYLNQDSQSKEFINLVYAGNPGENFEKENLDTIIDVFSTVSIRLKNIKLKIIGITKDKFIKTYYTKHKKNPILHNVSFMGRKPHLEVIRTVQESDYFIFFRPVTKANTAGFPTKMVEAFGSLTPTITNNVGDVGKYIQNGVNGYLMNTVDSVSLKEKLEFIVNQHGEHESLKKELTTSSPFDYNLYIDKFMYILK